MYFMNCTIDFAGINKSEGNVIERRGLASQPRSAVQRNRYPYISTPIPVISTNISNY
jgi:hypothetical protein